MTKFNKLNEWLRFKLLLQKKINFTLFPPQKMWDKYKSLLMNLQSWWKITSKRESGTSLDLMPELVSTDAAINLVSWFEMVFFEKETWYNSILQFWQKNSIQFCEINLVQHLFDLVAIFSWNLLLPQVWQKMYHPSNHIGTNLLCFEMGLFWCIKKRNK